MEGTPTDNPRTAADRVRERTVHVRIGVRELLCTTQR